MALPSITEILNTLTTATAKARAKEMPNQAFQKAVFWKQLLKSGTIKKFDGSRKITMDVEYGTNPTVKSFGRGGTLPGADFEYITQLELYWKYTGGAQLKNYADNDQNAGQYALRNLIVTGLNNLENSIIAKMETDAFLDGTGNSSQDILGLQKLVPDAAATGGTVGNIDGDANSWWRNKSYDMTSKSVSVYLRDYMKRLFNDCSLIDHGDQSYPNFYIADQKTTETYDTECYGLVSVVNNMDKGDLAISSLAFKGQPIHWSPKCPEVATNYGRLYMLNTNFLFLALTGTGAVKFVDWKPASSNSLDWILHGVCKSAFISNCRSAQGVLYNIQNPAL